MLSLHFRQQSFLLYDFASWRKHFFCGGAKCKQISRPDLKLETLNLKLNL